LEWNFIKVILTKDKERSKRDKERMRIRKSRYIKSDGTYCYIEKFNMALNLCRVLGITPYSYKGFLETAVGESISAETL